MATEHVTDHYLLEQIKAGHQHSFSILVDRHHQKYYQLAYRYTAQKEAAEEIVQDAFIKLWKNPYIWDDSKNTKFTTWFYRIIVNLALDKKRQFKFWPLPENTEIADKGPSQDDILEKEETQLLLEKNIMSLPDRQKTALHLCYYESVSHKEAATIMKISLSALESLLMRAKSTLKQNLKKYF
jgi:RNA polymerase sigma-70 factor (ECF subfamily)